MAFDGVFLYKTVEELKEGIDSHIDKIYQPSKDELVFLLRKKGFVKRLLITVRSGCARIHFTENKFENPPSPPMFCMLIRKHLSSARLTDIIQPGFERVVKLVFSGTNEMGDKTEISLICELIGNQSNIILVNSDGKILDSLRHSDIETSSRLILPGAVYEYPKSLEKHNPLTSNTEEIINKVDFIDGNISKSLLTEFDGFSPLICREIEDIYNNFIQNGINNKEALLKATKQIIECIKNAPMPTLLLSEDNSPFDFSYTDICQYANTLKKEHFESCSSLLDAFYTAKDLSARIKAESKDITRLVTNLKSRTEKKLALRLNELESCKDREKFRIYGELLKANLYTIENGSEKATVPNYYDENMADITIPLNPALSPAKNAERYFKEYKKSYAAEQALTALTEKDKEELIYFDTVLDNIARSTSIMEIGEIRDELTECGYIKKQVQKRKTNNVSKIKEFISPDGYKILVGKNNLQNDYITTKFSGKRDLWFHVKNIPGSHVVILCDGMEVSEDTILLASIIAATNSKASESSNVPVDYTQIKNVKKPNGAKPGMVIYTTNKTVYVTPDKKYLF